ncbi:MAG: GntR family transcriptional regulator [Acidimicrobiales bacterium]
MRTIRYKEIAATIRRAIESGELAAGALLPSEASLGTTHDVSRVTIRKALETLRSEGLVDSRQGFGWFVVGEQIPLGLSGLSTIEAQLRRSGRASARQVLEFSFVDARPVVADLLGARVLEVRRLNLVDGEPFARITVWCPEHLGAELSKADVERRSFQELVPVTLGGATQRIGAAVVTADDAELLGLPVGSAVLVVDRVTHDAAGQPVLVSEHVFPAHHAEFVVDLPASSAEEHHVGSPPGLRLVGP